MMWKDNMLLWEPHKRQDREWLNPVVSIFSCDLWMMIEPIAILVNQYTKVYKYLEDL